MTTISPVAETHPTYEPPSPENESPVTPAAGDPLAELAALLVETDFMRSEADEQAMRAAREAERRSMEREVQAMHDAADAVFVGACVQGGAALAGGAAACAGSVMQVDSAKTDLNVGLVKGGEAASGVAKPLGGVLGDAPKAHADARAADARNDGERADTRADEAAEHRERVLGHTESVLDLVEGTLQSEHQGNFAILGNF